MSCDFITPMRSLEEINRLYQTDELFAYTINEDAVLIPAYTCCGKWLGYVITWILNKICLRTNQHVAIDLAFRTLSILYSNLQQSFRLHRENAPLRISTLENGNNTYEIAVNDLDNTLRTQRQNLPKELNVFAEFADRNYHLWQHAESHNLVEKIIALATPPPANTHIPAPHPPIKDVQQRTPLPRSRSPHDHSPLHEISLQLQLHSSSSDEEDEYFPSDDEGVVTPLPALNAASTSRTGTPLPFSG